MDARLERASAPTLFYQVEGAGPPVVLIHGVGADGASWDDIAPVLAPRFTVIRLDLRGHGRSGHIDGALALGDAGCLRRWQSRRLRRGCALPD